MKQIVSGDNITFRLSSSSLRRTRLYKMLNDAMNYPLIIVYAGTGYGKTSTIYSFLKEYDAHITWLQINEQSNTPAIFWENYANTVSLSWPESGKRLLEIGFPQTDDLFEKYKNMVQEASVLSGKYVIVYDDFHLLHNPDVLRLFEKTVNIMPQNTIVIVISRTVPEFNLIKMMMSESIVTISEDNLHFTEDEITEYFNQLGIKTTRQNIQDIFESTRGWPFSINLIARALIKEVKYDRHILEAMKINIFKFIKSEIFLTIPEPVRLFLARISLIDHLAANLIRALAKDETLIKEIERLNAYIRYDFDLDAYIINNLFLEFLQQNQYLLTKEERDETYQKAAEWCELNDYQKTALSYYEKSENYNAIMQIIYPFNLQVPQDIAIYASEIFERMPEDIKENNPLFPAMNLKLKMSQGLLDESLILVERYAKEYEARPESPSKHRALVGIYGAWATLRFIMSPYTDVYDFDIYFKKQRSYYDKAPFSSFGSPSSRSVSTYTLLIGTNRIGAPEEYINALEKSISYMPNTLRNNLYGLDDLTKGELYFFQRKIDNAEKSLRQALDKARMCDQYAIQDRALLYLMQIAFFRGDFNTANTIMQTLESLLYEKKYDLRYVTYDIDCGFYYLALGQPKQIADWLKGDFSPYMHPAFLENYANRVKMQYHYQTRQYNALLAFIENELDKQVILFSKIEFKILEALSLYQIKRRDEALAALTASYNLAKSNGIVTPFIQYAKDMRTLTAAALKSDACKIPASWLEDINRKASAFAKKQTHMISEYKAAIDFVDGVSLTRRETEILIDLSHGLSRSEIAANQNISINTVKMAVNIIYEKLHANSLADAIRIASDLKII